MQDDTLRLECIHRGLDRDRRLQGKHVPTPGCVLLASSVSCNPELLI